MTRTRNQAGFTLIEVLVILAIIAVLAGVLVPALTGQIRKGQVNRVLSDLNNVRSAATAFFSDVNRYPGDLHDVSTQIASTDRDVNAAIYPTNLITKWAGPYIDKTIADGATLSSGFGGVIQDDFTVNANTNNVNYLTVRVTGLSSIEFAEIDKAIDEGNGASTGRLRFTTGDTLKYYAVPLQ